MAIEFVIETPNTEAGHRFIVPLGSIMTAARASQLCSTIRDDGNVRAGNSVGLGRRITQSARGSARTGLLKVMVSGIRESKTAEVDAIIHDIADQVPQIVESFDKEYIARNIILESPALCGLILPNWAENSSVHNSVTNGWYNSRMRNVLIGIVSIVATLAALMFGDDIVAKIKSFISDKSPFASRNEHNSMNIEIQPKDIDARWKNGKDKLLLYLKESNQLNNAEMPVAFDEFLHGCVGGLSAEEKRFLETMEPAVVFDNLERFRLLRSVFGTAEEVGGWSDKVAVSALSEKQGLTDPEMTFLEGYQKRRRSLEDVKAERRQLAKLHDFAEQYFSEFPPDETTNEARKFRGALNDVLIPLSVKLHRPSDDSHTITYQSLPLFAYDELTMAANACHSLNSSKNWEDLFREDFAAIQAEINGGCFLGMELTDGTKESLKKKLATFQIGFEEEGARFVTILSSLIDGLAGGDLSYPKNAVMVRKPGINDSGKNTHSFPVSSVAVNDPPQPFRTAYAANNIHR